MITPVHSKTNAKHVQNRNLIAIHNHKDPTQGHRLEKVPANLEPDARVRQVMRIVDNVRPDRQTVMFSATFPRAMEALARRILAKPIEVLVGGRSVVCSDVQQHVVRVPVWVTRDPRGGNLP